MSLPPGSAVAIPVLAAVAVALAAWCLIDLARAGQVRYLPKWAWAVVICVSVPWGGLAALCQNLALTGTAVAVSSVGYLASEVPPIGKRGQFSPGFTQDLEAATATLNPPSSAVRRLVADCAALRYHVPRD